MNALEMRKISAANTVRLGERETKEAIEELKQKISKNASEGLWDAQILISTKSALVRSGRLNQVVTAFEEKEFKVNHGELNDSLFGDHIVVTVSWRSDE